MKTLHKKEPIIINDIGRINYGSLLTYGAVMVAFLTTVWLMVI
jgi:hypothetical protein